MLIWIKVSKSGSYGSRVTLRSSYLTMSSSEMKSMLKRRGFFDKYDNKSGNFQNDFRSKIIGGDMVVVDRATGLMWQQGGSSNHMYFEGAKRWVEDLNRQGYAGYHDWRLPTIEEGASLMENSEKNGDLYIDPLFSKKQRYLWTGDRFSSSSAWVVYFSYGNFNSYNFSSFNYVRAVRSGQ